MSNASGRARNLLLAQFGIIAILAGLHHLAINLYLYWRFPWFDLLTHLIGGMWVALLAAWLLALRNKIPYFFACLFAAFVFGVMWEIFEAQNLIIDIDTDALDSVKDILLTVLGGGAGAFLAKSLSN